MFLQKNYTKKIILFKKNLWGTNDISTDVSVLKGVFKMIQVTKKVHLSNEK